MRARIEAVYLALVLALWLGLAAALAAFTSKVADWFVMTDELLYERLALSIARTDSPLPQIHGESIANINQLYPIVIAPALGGTSIVEGLHDAHVLNAFVMTSAVVPVYLLARRLGCGRWLPFVAALASVVVPWLTLSSFLLTEVVAYPVFAWALLALQAAVARPSARNDALVVVAIAMAVLARTQFYALAVVLPVVVVGQAAVGGRIRTVLRAHRVLVGVYVVGIAAALALVASGRSPLGTYGQTASENPLPLSLLGSVPAHVAVVALAGGLLPFLVGGAWAVSNLGRSETGERHVFAWVVAVSFCVLVVEVASFDERFGGGVVRERYLFYVTPMLACALVAALTAWRVPRWSIAGPLALFLVGVTQADLPVFQKLNVDTPAAIVDDWLRSTMHGLGGARIALALAAIVVVLLYVEASLLVPRLAVAVGASILLVAVLTAETGYAFKRLFAVDGTSGLPLTLDQSSVFSWVDRQITPASEAVMIPYAVIRGDYWANVGFWWDLEFWNASVDREAAPDNEFTGTPPGSFPKLDIRFDPRTGLSNVDLDSYVAQAANDARFRLRGREQVVEREVSLVFPDRPWRADWVSYGLFPDGWTRPGTAARFRVFGTGGDGRTRRILTFTLIAPPSTPARTVHLRSNEGSWRIDAVTNATPIRAAVCVPADGFADVSVRADGVSEISVDQLSAESFGRPRAGGVLVANVNLAPELEQCTKG